MSDKSPLRKEMERYATDALTVRDRPDVYLAIIQVFRNWHAYAGGDEERAHVFARIRAESNGNPRLAVHDPLHRDAYAQGYGAERQRLQCKQTAWGALAAYENEMKRKF